MSWRVAAVALAMAVSMGVARASVPLRERIEQAVAQTNAAAGRGQALQLELVMQIGDRPAVARGELLSHPAGMARLELRGAGDLVERHLLQGKLLLAARDGQLLEDHRFFLPPLFVLQASDGEALRSALLSFEVEPESVGLAQCGEEDCLVLGDPERQIHPVPGPEPAGLEEYEQLKGEIAEAQRLQYEAARVWFWGGFDRLLVPWLSQQPEPGGEGLDEVPLEEDASGLTERIQNGAAKDQRAGTSAREAEPAATPAEPGLGPVAEAMPAPPPQPIASLWVSREGYEIRGIDTASGGRVRLGPLASFGGVLVPAWILIEEPGQEPVRFEVVGATRVAAPPARFSEQWLLAPPALSPGETADVSPQL